MRKTTTITESGRELLYIPLSYDKKKNAVLWKDDFEFLSRLGISSNWSTSGMNNTYVVCSVPGRARRKVQVARILLDAYPGEQVKYLDGDTFNLRRENLRLVKGGLARFRARDLLSLSGG